MPRAPNKDRPRLPDKVIGQPIPTGTLVCEHGNLIRMVCKGCADECERRYLNGDEDDRRDHHHPYARHCSWGVHPKE